MRRTLTAVMALSAALLCLTWSDASYAQDRPFAGVTLRVGTWGGSWREARHELIGQKLEEMGAKVEYVIGTPRDNFAKLLTARRQGNPDRCHGDLARADAHAGEAGLS